VDVLFFCRDGLYDSLITNLVLAISLRKIGKEVAVIFSGGALHDLCHGIIRYPDSLAGVEIRKTISVEAKSMGLPLQNSRDSKSLDIRPLLLQAKDSGVSLYACPIWSILLKLGDRLPQELSSIPMEKLLEKITSSTRIIGGF
jgi:peroxiredoxin family protein